MLTYNSSLQSQPPVDAVTRNAHLAGIRKRSPYAAYGQNHQDVLNAMTERQATNLDMATQQANTNYTLQQQQAQRQLALEGLNQMAQAQQNQNSLANTRLQNTVGFASDLLRGLFN